MKIAAFSVRQDEKQYFDTFANVYKVVLSCMVIVYRLRMQII